MVGGVWAGLFCFAFGFFSLCYSVGRKHSLYVIPRFNKNLIKYVLPNLTIDTLLGALTPTAFVHQ